MDKDMKHLLEKLRDMGNCMSSLWEESGLLAQTMREMQKLGTEMSELAKTALVETDEPEKPKRKIDLGGYNNWKVMGDVVMRGRGKRIAHASDAFGALGLIAAAPDAMRAMIDFVNRWDLMLADPDLMLPRLPGYPNEYIEKFKKIITDAGFACDIKERDNG